MYRIAVVDGDELCLKYIGAMLNRYGEERGSARVSFEGFQSAFDLMDAVENGTDYDIFLLDVVLPGMSGMAVAKEIRKKEMATPIIFVTSDKQSALEAFRVGAVDYLIKGTFSYEELKNVLDRTLQISEHERRETVILTTRSGFRHLYCRNIMYTIANKNYQTIVLENGDSFEVRMSHKALTEKLVKGENFVDVGSSYVVNMFFIAEIAEEIMKMRDSYSIQIPRRQKKAIVERFRGYSERIDLRRARNAQA